MTIYLLIESTEVASGRVQMPEGVKMKRTKWTDEKIIDGVKEVIEGTGMKRMPTSSEVNSYYGNYKLSNAISKKKAWGTIANQLGLEIKDSETAFGKSYEARAMETLIIKGYEVDKMAQNFPYDLLVDNAIKVDVKASRIHKGSNGNFYTFNIEKRYATCDVYILYLVGSQNEIYKTLIVPSKFVVRNTQISIGEYTSKYHRFEDRWDYIETMVKNNEDII